MDHVVYLDAKANEMENLLSGEKKMIIRGAMGRKLPYGKVNEGDFLYLINNNGQAEILARCIVESVFNSEKMTPAESAELIEKNQDKLVLTEKQVQRWSGKRYLVLIGVKNVETVPSFRINKSEYKNMDDWLPVGDIEKVKM